MLNAQHVQILCGIATTKQASITLKTWTYSHKDKYQTLIHTCMHDHDAQGKYIPYLVYI